MTRRPLPLILSAMLLAMVSGASAQQRHDSNAPIDVSADHSELQDRANRAVFSGNVLVRQAEMTVAAARATLAYTGSVVDGNPQISRLDAAGDVVITRPDQSARCAFAVYDLNSRTILLLGGVVLTQGTNVTRGERITLDLDAHNARVDAAPGGRVTGRFSVPKRDDK